MASFRALETVSNALTLLLRSSFDAADFDGTSLRFEVYLPSDFATPMSAGVSVLLHRVGPNGHRRIPPGRLDALGQPQRRQLPLDLHYLLTVWAQTASMQHRVAGWMLRALEDVPILPHGLLEAAAPGVFHPDETVELILGDLGGEELFRIWEALTDEGYRLSVPYVARGVYVESRQSDVQGAPVETRAFTFSA
jgi:hypothetical protein